MRVAIVDDVKFGYKYNIVFMESKAHYVFINTMTEKLKIVDKLERIRSPYVDVVKRPYATVETVKSCQRLLDTNGRWE